MTPIRWRAMSVAGFVVVAMQTLPHCARACEFAFTNPYPGVLTGSEDFGGTVPRNVAFLTTNRTPKQAGSSDVWLPARFTDGQLVPAVEVLAVVNGNDRDVIVKPTEPLPADATIEVVRWGAYEGHFVTNDVIDDIPPIPPSVSDGILQQHDGNSGCVSDSCGDYTYMHVKLSALASDDVTPQSKLVYAIFLGATAHEAATKRDADFLLAGSALSSDVTIYENVDADNLTRDVFVSIAALDQSANISERTKPIQIHSAEDESCAIARHRRRLGFDHLLVCLLAIAGFGRRAFRGGAPGRTAN